MDLHGVPLARWQAECEARRLSVAEKEKDRDRVIRKASTDLRDTGRIAVRDGLVWLARKDQADG
jgi:hypothetical protein